MTMEEPAGKKGVKREQRRGAGFHGSELLLLAGFFPFGKRGVRQPGPYSADNQIKLYIGPC